MRKLNFIVKDIVKCVVWGSFIAIGIILIVGIISLLVSKLDYIKALQSIRSSLLIIGPLVMILGALLILKNKNDDKLMYIEQWKKKYKIFSYKGVLIIISFIIIFYGGAVDLIIISLK